MNQPGALSIKKSLFSIHSFHETEISKKDFYFYTEIEIFKKVLSSPKTEIMLNFIRKKPKIFYILPKHKFRSTL